MSEDKDWKTKYFNSLKQLDDADAKFDDLDQFLRKAVSRLAITAKGQHKKLDGILSRIQNHTRAKKDIELSVDLEELSTCLATMESSLTDVPVAIKETETETETETEAGAGAEAVQAQPSQVSSIRSDLLKIIEQIKFDVEFQSNVTEFKSSIESMKDSQCVSRLAELINQFYDYKSENKADIQEVLLSLVEKVSLLHGNSEQLSVIKKRLEDSYTEEGWGRYLDEIIKEIQVILKGINHEKIELEGLIVDVTRQLNEISVALTDDQSDSIEGRKETQHLQSMMTENVESMITKVKDETDISLLKHGLNENLSLIKQGVESFVQKDAERFHKAQERNNRLQKQIHLMEDESEQLKKKLSDNRQKLMFDALTGARSRLSYDELLDQEFSRWSRYKEAFSFAILDIDLFKRVNDSFGHNAGDKALQIVAKMMMKYVRKTDFLFRIGGEEFVLLLPKTSLKNAAPLVEKIRTSVGESNFHFKNERVVISLSAGLTAVLPSDNVESIYERADAALYDAKNGGRNQLVVKEAMS